MLSIQFFISDCLAWSNFLHNIDDLDATEYIQEHFKVSPSKMTWQEGREYCQRMGGDLSTHGMQNLTVRR